MKLEEYAPGEIEKRSFAIIEEELGRELDPVQKPIIKRVIHTTADFSYADTLFFSEGAVEEGLNALRSGVSIVTKVSGNTTVFSYPRVLIHYNRRNMINQKPFLKTVFRYFKTEPVSQYIFFSMVPEKSHLIPQIIYLPGIRSAGNSVFMIFRMPERPQILPNPVKFGPQQPCTQIGAVPASKI